ncbi:response regulator [Streptomyces sp. NPDC050658]|uniref:response regulator transcription factor n=1 Tax=unclassified Streptomyces TaxID=2593676 RepID=UPI00344AEDB4
MRIRIAVIDDQVIVRAGLRTLVEYAEGFEVVAEADDGTHAVPLAEKHRPDVVLMDLSMPGLDGLEATRLLMRLPTPPHVLILSVYDADTRVLDALRAGASGFLLKDLQPQELFAALRTVVAGGRVIDDNVLSRLVRQAAERAPAQAGAIDQKLCTLSESERRVLALIGAGLTNAEIADRLNWPRSSVKTYVSRNLDKLGVESRTQAALLAYRYGLTASEPEAEAAPPGHDPPCPEVSDSHSEE